MNHLPKGSIIPITLFRAELGLRILHSKPYSSGFIADIEPIAGRTTGNFLGDFIYLVYQRRLVGLLAGNTLLENFTWNQEGKAYRYSEGRLAISFADPGAPQNTILEAANTIPPPPLSLIKKPNRLFTCPFCGTHDFYRGGYKYTWLGIYYLTVVSDLMQNADMCANGHRFLQSFFPRPRYFILSPEYVWEQWSSGVWRRNLIILKQNGKTYRAVKDYQNRETKIEMVECDSKGRKSCAWVSCCQKCEKLKEGLYAKPCLYACNSFPLTCIKIPYRLQRKGEKLSLVPYVSQ